MLVVHGVIHRENLVAKMLLLNCTKYYILWSNVSIPWKQIPKQKVCSRVFVKLSTQIIGSGVTRDLSPGEITAGGGPPANIQQKIEKW